MQTEVSIAMQFHFIAAGNNYEFLSHSNLDQLKLTINSVHTFTSGLNQVGTKEIGLALTNIHLAT